MVVVNPMSRMIIVEKELTTPFGMALFQLNQHETEQMCSTDDSRCEDTDENENSLGIKETQLDLTLIKGLVFNAHVVTRNAFDSDKSLTLREKAGICR